MAGRKPKPTALKNNDTIKSTGVYRHPRRSNV